jgi:hypothetical protein
MSIFFLTVSPPALQVSSGGSRKAGFIPSLLRQPLRPFLLSEDFHFFIDEFIKKEEERQSLF